MKNPKERKYKFENYKQHVLIDYDGTYKVLYCPSVSSVDVYSSRCVVVFHIPNSEDVEITRKNYTYIDKVLKQFESWGGNCPINFHN